MQMFIAFGNDSTKFPQRDRTNKLFFLNVRNKQEKNSQKTH